MLGNRRILAIILAVIMTFTITGQVSVFAVEGDGQATSGQELQNPAEDGQQSSTTEGDASANEDEDSGAVTAEEEEPAQEAAEDENVIFQAEGMTLVGTKPTGTSWNGKVIDISWYNPSQNSFTIKTAAEFAGLAAIVNGSFDRTITQVYAGSNPEAVKYIKSIRLEDFRFVGAGGGNTNGTCYKATGENDFMGKIVHIAANLDMTGGNYMPIGGKYPMSDENGSLIVDNKGGKGDAHVIEAYFNGILDCGGHTIKIKCDRYTESGFAYSMAAGLIGFMGNVIDEDEVDEHKEQYDFKVQKMSSNWTPSVRNVSLEGSVYARRMVGGIVGEIGPGDDSDCGVLIENCANHASVESTDAKGAGGIIAAGWGKGKILNCYNTGTITASYSTSPVGGICAGNGGMDIYNCYNTGQMKGNDRGRGIGGHDSGSYTIDNCYNLNGTNSDKNAQNSCWYSGTAADITLGDLTLMDRAQMQSEDFAQYLNSDQYMDSYNHNVFKYIAGKNDNYPVLYFEGGVNGADCKVNIASVANGTISASYNGKSLSDGDLVPYGAIVKLKESHNAGYILSSYTAKKAGDEGNASKLIGDFCTVTDEVTIGADIRELKQGTLEIQEGSKWDVNVTKKGVALTDGQIQNVKRQKVLDGNSIYQQDVLSVSADLHRNAVPSDVNKEYSGEFTYTFEYGNGRKVTNETGVLKVDGAIDKSKITVSATPKTEDKTWLSFADTSWYYEGENGENYIIDSAEDLAGLAYLVNIEGETFKGETIEIPEGSVISLKNTDGRGGEMLWPGIGINSVNAYFEGTLIGGGSTIMDMRRVNEADSNGGLFNYICNAEIKGIRVRGETSVSSSGAGIAGYADNSTITDCINYASVQQENDRGGGITADTKGCTITGCINRGSITGSTGIGGIAGYCYGEISKISKCSNYGDVKSEGYSVSYNYQSSGKDGTGGICGRLFGDMSLCCNYGKISSTDVYTGGLAGYVARKQNAAANTVSYSYNQGSIDARGANSQTTGKMKGIAAGGLVGASHSFVLTKCYSTGTVSGTSGNVNICSGVGYFECNSGTKATYNYVLYTSGSAWNKPSNLKPTYIYVTKMKATDMKAAAFVKTMSSTYFEGVSGSYPRFKRFSETGNIEKTCKVTFTGDLSKSFIINYGGSIETSSIPAGPWKKYEFTSAGEEWTGHNITSDVTVDVRLTDVSKYNVIFKAPGQSEAIGTLQYDKDTAYESLSKPESIPAPEGYTAVWPEDVQLNTEGDTVVNAIYYPSGSKLNVQDTASVSSGVYYIGGKSTGVITINEGETVKLIGDSGMCENLRVVMEKNSTLTIKNLQMLDEAESVLTMNTGCKLILEGKKNRIEGVDTASKDCVPAINVLGNSEISTVGQNSEGVLSATADTRDTVIDIADGVALTFKGGTIKLYKESKIGAFDGGLINSGRDTASGTGEFRMDGGVLYCIADSDNMHAVKVGKFTMNGGDALIMSNDEDKALFAGTIQYGGGNLKVVSADYDKNETDKSEAHRTYFYNEDAIDCESFTNTYSVQKLFKEGLNKPYRVTAGSMSFNCEGLVRDFDIDKAEFVKSSETEIYAWVKAGAEAEIFDAGADMSQEDNRRGYSADINGNIISAELTGTRAHKKIKYMACAAYDKDGNMVEFNYSSFDGKGSVEMKSASEEGTEYIKVFLFRDINSLVPGLTSYRMNLN